MDFTSAPSPARLFLIDTLKGYRTKKNLATSVSDGVFEGRPMKVVSMSMQFPGTDVEDVLTGRMWIDLHRNGHVVYCESYSEGEVAGRTNYTLRSFKIGGEDVWMPIASRQVGYLEKRSKGELVEFSVAKEPTYVGTLSIIGRTLEFNKHPGDNVFTAKYKPGTPVTDNIRQLKYRYEQDKLKPVPTKAEVEKMLDDQLAKAEAQKSELYVAQEGEGVNWWAWSTMGLAGLTAASLVILRRQRRAA